MALREPKKDNSSRMNLNNEVVLMRKEVSRVRGLLIRKLTRQIAALKKKKGKENEVQKNQRRAERMVEEIHEMKALKPDVVGSAFIHSCSFTQGWTLPCSPVHQAQTLSLHLG
uniref:Uncharacterized protein n=1 Tax=Gadus morhua TaxID=8049 RepID=A0A8C5CH76_GADMO